MNESIKRKPNRIKNYDYSQHGAYFITICTKDHAPLFGNIVGAAPYRLQMTDIGMIVESEISTLNNTYQNVSVDCFIIMPNHVHMIISINDNDRRQDAAPTISRMINQWKRTISIKVGFSPWQKSFHDHVIRNQEDYNRIAEYIEHNPMRWADDRYYQDNTNGN
jgi:REP element-mobilizing transposase RayT